MECPLTPTPEAHVLDSWVPTAAVFRNETSEKRLPREDSGFYQWINPLVDVELGGGSNQRVVPGSLP